VAGEVLLRVEAADDQGVEAVEFWVDGVRVHTATEPPWASVWDASQSPAGRRRLRAVARDFSGNSAETTEITVRLGSSGGGGGLGSAVGSIGCTAGAGSWGGWLALLGALALLPRRKRPSELTSSGVTAHLWLPPRRGHPSLGNG
jgi:hypothetical protein